jgi:ABC-type multidrug transport system ATPase subunit
MKITLDKVGKRFQRNRIFKDVSYVFEAPGAYALLGPNGSGKSTLLRIISGMQSPSTGKLLFERADGVQVAVEKVFSDLSFCAPGQELVEEFTMREFLDFHFSFKKIIAGYTVADLITLAGMEQAADKPIYDYSSGMKQRVKLLQAIFSDTPILMLDEPCTNLDERGVAQYREWIAKHAAGRLVLVASNDPREYDFCKETLVVADYQ